MDYAEELAAFRTTQRLLRNPFRRDGITRTVVVVPSMTMDTSGLVKIPGVQHYEERLLFVLQQLRDPDARVVYVTSEPIVPEIVDYALDLVTSLPRGHARKRLTMLSCGSGEPISLTAKILRRPGMIDRIRAAVGDPRDAVLLTFTGTELERTLAVRLGIPLFAPDPDLAGVGTKTGARLLFAEAGVPVVPGMQGLRDEADVAAAVALLRAQDDTLPSAIVKLNDGFGASGNVLFSYAGAPTTGLTEWVRRELPRRAVFASPPDTWADYAGRIAEVGAVVERFVEAVETTSPSAQVLVTPDGTVGVVSTHDQVLSGAHQQIFVGCTFPARAAYRSRIQELASRVGRTLADRSMVGLFSVDFISARTSRGWRHHALEINLRMGGGTAPFFLLHGLVQGEYDQRTAQYRCLDGTPRAYFATDRLYRDEYRALDAERVIDVLVRDGLHYSAATRTGAAGYMLGALEIGRCGIIVVDEDTASARRGYRGVVAALDAETELLTGATGNHSAPHHDGRR